MITYDSINIDGVRIFYRETAAKDKPALVLLHGFPSSSHMFRELMPMLGESYHIIAPDYPGFGQSGMPPRSEFDYTFDHLAEIMEHFLTAKQIDCFYLCVFDYGAPIGSRIALKQPERILGIISQNGNVYREGIGEKWKARAAYWADPTPALREQFKSAFAKETIIGQYTFGAPALSVSPDGYALDIFYSQRPGYAQVQSDLILDYQTNVALYPAFQAYLRKYQPPLLAVWGKNDPSFMPAGAFAFLRDVPDAQIHLVDSGHFALESHCAEIAGYMLDFLIRCDCKNQSKENGGNES